MAELEPSILRSVKKGLNIGPDDTSFDLDVIMYVNSAFSVLADLGIGPKDGFAIEDDTAVWIDFTDANSVIMAQIKMAVLLRTRLAFDPPTVGFLLDAMKKTLEETEWRLNVNRETEAWTDPLPPTPDLEDVVEIDGGTVG